MKRIIAILAIATVLAIAWAGIKTADDIRTLKEQRTELID